MASRPLAVVAALLSVGLASAQDAKSIMAGAKGDPTLEKTEAALAELLKKSPNDVFGWLSLGVVEEGRKQPAKALDAYGNVVRLDPAGAWGAEAKMRQALLKSGLQGDDRALSMLGQALMLRRAGRLPEALDLATSAKTYAETVGWQCDLLRANLMAFFGQVADAEALLSGALETAPAKGKPSLQEELGHLRFRKFAASLKEAALEASKSRSPDSTAKLERAWRTNPVDTLVGLLLASEATTQKRYALAEEVAQSLANSSSPEARAPAQQISKMLQELKGMERDLKVGASADLAADSSLKGMGLFVDPGTDVDGDTPVAFQPEAVNTEGRRKRALKVVEIDLDIAQSVLRGYEDRERAWKATADEVASQGGDPAYANERAVSAASLVRLTKRKVELLQIVAALFTP